MPVKERSKRKVSDRNLKEVSVFSQKIGGT